MAPARVTQAAAPISPSHLFGLWARPAKGWWRALLAAWSEAGADSIDLIAAGVAFYGFLALVPLLGAITLVYGLMATPAVVVENIRSLTVLMPPEAAKLIGDQLLAIVTASGGKKGLGLALSLLLSLYGAMNAAATILTAMNVASDQREGRSFFHLKLLSLAITAAGLAITLATAICVGSVTQISHDLTKLPTALVVVGTTALYLAMALVGAAVAATLYRFGPQRRLTGWVLITPGSVFTAISWLTLALGFGIYVANFSNYDATYGSLGAVVVLLMWLYFSAYTLLLGAELNTELCPPARPTSDADTSSLLPLKGADSGADPDFPCGDREEAFRSSILPIPQHNLRNDLVVAHATARVGHFVGMQQLKLLPSVLATTGLMLLRRRGGASLGAAILAGAGALAWLGRTKALEPNPLNPPQGPEK